MKSDTFGQVDNSTDFNWQNANYTFTCRLKSDAGDDWSGSTEGRAYFWGLAESGITTLTNPFHQKTAGRILDESYAGFYVDGDDNLYALSGTGEVTSGAANLASMDITDLSAYDHTDFHDYKIVTSYAAFPSISNSGLTRPTAHSGGNSNQANMYDADTNTAGFAERQSGESDAIGLSWDAGTTYTHTILNTINAAKTAVTLGGQYETWGRTWSASDFSDANFRVKLGGVSSLSPWGSTFSNSITFSTFGFTTTTWQNITGIEIELTSDTEDEGDGGVAEHRIYDIRVKVYFTTTANTGYVKFYIDNTLVATHQTSIPRNTDNPIIFFAGGPNGENESSGKHIFFNNYQLTADIN